jgi:uncharacterized protein YdeI (YjbR/CyaY-like superfamily)
MVQVASFSELPELQFKTAKCFTIWLAKNHAQSSGIWLRFAKKASGIASVSREEAVEAAICFGWIDGQIRPGDHQTYLVRYGPRANRSIWSKLNREKTALLIEQGRMQPAGRLEIERAQADGRWDAAYDPPSTATVPEDLQAALNADPHAKAFFATLDAANRYAILFRLQTAKKAETRVRNLERFIAMLRERRTIHPTRPSGSRRSTPATG